MIERQENGGDKRDSLASWLRPDGSRRYVPANTLCLFPRKPHRLRARRPGFEVTLRCYDCPGCREFEAQRLARRLVETYRALAGPKLSGECQETSHKQQSVASQRPRLFALRIYCPKELHASTSRRMHRWRGVEIEPGFFRAGVDSFIVLSRAPDELVARLRRRRSRVHVRPIGNLKRARSWRRVARGLIVIREVYGENLNRWYRRGLAPAAKEHFEVYKIDVYKTFDRARDPRAISEGQGRLVPPKVFELRRGVRLHMRSAFRRATSPEAVDYIMPEVLALVRRVAKPLVVSAVPKTAEELERNREFNIRMARNEPARTDHPISEIIPPQVVGEVSEVLVNSGSFEERRKRRYEALMNAPPMITEFEREEEERRRRAENASTGTLALRSKKKWLQIRESFLRKGEEAAKANGQSDQSLQAPRDRGGRRPE